MFEILRRARTCRVVVASLVVVLVQPGAFVYANDSSAALSAGGLELIKNDQVRMVSEVLRMAPRLVQVDYIFENIGRDDVTTLVAFPLPDLDQRVLSVRDVSLAFEGAANFVGFEVWSDGRKIDPDIEVRAFDHDGREVTAELKRLGIDPVKPILDEARHGAVLRSVHLAEFEGRDILPNWITRVSFHWLQTFAGGKQVTVRHRYRPVYGEFFASSASDGLAGLQDEQSKVWCPDAGFKAAERRLLAEQREAEHKASPPDDQKLTFYDNVQYVLKTGANWYGTIGRFELQIDKGGADLVSTCPIPGLSLQRKPYGFSAVATDYTPSTDLDILFVSRRFLGKPNGSPPGRE